MGDPAGTGRGKRRDLPGSAGKCRRCGAVVVWAVTSAGPNGRGGKAIPLDPREDPDGNVAVRQQSHRRLVARVLGKDETHDLEHEYRAMPHFATCQPTLIDPKQPLPGNVIDFNTARRTRGARR